MQSNKAIASAVEGRPLGLREYAWPLRGLPYAPGTAIVGDPETVAARIREYQDIGFDTFIVSGQPLLEETYRVADLLLPLLPFDRSAVEKPQLELGPFYNTARAR